MAPSRLGLFRVCGVLLLPSVFWGSQVAVVVAEQQATRAGAETATYPVYSYVNPPKAHPNAPQIRTLESGSGVSAPRKRRDCMHTAHTAKRPERPSGLGVPTTAPR